MLFASAVERYKRSTASQTTSQDTVKISQKDAPKPPTSQGYLFSPPSPSPKASSTVLRPSMLSYRGTFYHLERRYAALGPAQPLARDASLPSAWSSPIN